jgi:hypothetical protein
MCLGSNWPAILLNVLMILLFCQIGITTASNSFLSILTISHTCTCTQAFTHARARAHTHTLAHTSLDTTVAKSSQLLLHSIFCPFHSFFDRPVFNFFSPFNQVPISFPRCHTQRRISQFNYYVIPKLKMKRNFLEYCRKYLSNRIYLQ